jgi:hypothetical protein
MTEKTSVRVGKNRSDRCAGHSPAALSWCSRSCDNTHHRRLKGNTDASGFGSRRIGSHSEQMSNGHRDVAGWTGIFQRVSQALLPPRVTTRSLVCGVRPSRYFVPPLVGHNAAQESGGRCTQRGVIQRGMLTYAARSKHNPVSVGITDLSFQFVCHGVLLLPLFVMRAALFFPAPVGREWLFLRNGSFLQSLTRFTYPLAGLLP